MPALLHRNDHHLALLAADVRPHVTNILGCESYTIDSFVALAFGSFDVVLTELAKIDADHPPGDLTNVLVRRSYEACDYSRKATVHIGPYINAYGYIEPAKLQAMWQALAKYETAQRLFHELLVPVEPDHEARLDIDSYLVNLGKRITELRSALGRGKTRPAAGSARSETSPQPALV